MPYAVIDPDGNVVDVVPDVQAALDVGGQITSEVVVENGPEDPNTVGLQGQLGALGAWSDMPKQALKFCSVKPQRFPANMSLEEAHARLLHGTAADGRPFFPKTKLVAGKKTIVQKYLTPNGMADALLGQNYKTAKSDPDEEPADVQGLSLLPARSLKAQPGFQQVNACVGASAACVASCLVYSGRNDADPYNAVVKASRYRALLGDPQAFLRMLSESIARHERRREHTDPFVRLNVFSDLPWELICPELFEVHQAMQFYDYTKVENRETPANYDLTFSFSGANADRVGRELDKDRRIAVVFVPPKRVPAKGRARGEGLPEVIDVAELFGSELGELIVLDGDVSDVRPRDMAPAIVGLRWKIPMGRQEEAFAQAREATFAVPVIETKHGDLIAATSARQEPISDGDDD